MAKEISIDIETRVSELVTRLCSSDRDKATGLILALPPEAGEFLLGAYGVADEHDRKRLADVIVTFDGLHSAIDLRPTLADLAAKRLPAADAVELLTALGEDHRELKFWLKRAGSDDPTERRAAADRLSRWPDALPALVKMLSDPELVHIAAASIGAMGEAGEPAVTELMSCYYENYLYPITRVNVIDALGKVGRGQHVRQFILQSMLFDYQMARTGLDYHKRALAAIEGRS